MVVWNEIESEDAETKAINYVFIGVGLSEATECKKWIFFQPLYLTKS